MKSRPIKIGLFLLICVLITIALALRGNFRNFQISHSENNFKHKKMLTLIDEQLIHSNKSKIFIRQRGRLGNLMFIFSAGLGLSVKYNRTLRYGANFWKKGSCFDIDKRFIEQNNYSSKFSKAVKLSEKNSRMYAKSIADKLSSTYKSSNKSMYVKGFLQSWKYFDNIFDELRHFFKNYFRTNHVGLKFVENLRKETGRIPVGIHVRLSDTSSDKRLRGGTESYFRTAIKIMKSLIYPKKPVFVILTDDRLKVFKRFQKLFFIQNNSVFVPKNISSSCVDLEVSASCDHTIMTHGTFGWWGAFLSNGHNIYIKNYAVEYMHFYNITKPEDFFLENWIGLKV